MRNDTNFMWLLLKLVDFTPTASAKTTTPYSYNIFNNIYYSALTTVTSTAVVSHTLDSKNNYEPSETYESTHTGSDDARAPKCQQNQYQSMEYFKIKNRNLKNEIKNLNGELCKIK